MDFFKIFFIGWLVYSQLFNPSPEGGQNSQVVQRLQEKELRLIVMRHGEATHNTSQTITSARTLDSELTENGVTQITEAAQKLSKEGIDWIYVSPLYRTIQTAQLICKQLNIPENRIVVDELLAEQYFGEYENRLFIDYLNHYASPMDIFTETPPNGEPSKEVSQRTNKFLYNLASSHSHETILVITHGFNYCHFSTNIVGFIEEIPDLSQFRIYPFVYNHENTLE